MVAVIVFYVIVVIVVVVVVAVVVVVIIINVDVVAIVIIVIQRRSMSKLFPLKHLSEKKLKILKFLESSWWEKLLTKFLPDFMNKRQRGSNLGLVPIIN